MRKSLILALAAVFLFGLTSMVFAKPATTSGKGSLLVWPKIEVEGDKDTIIRISNDDKNDVNLKCYWIGKDSSGDWKWQDFTIVVTKFQPVWFSAKSGNGMASFRFPVDVEPFPYDEGELKCFAVNDTAANEIRHNHLGGEAVVFDSSAQYAYEYNAWRFARIEATSAPGVPQPTVDPADGQLNLDNWEYDACPQWVIHNFFAPGSVINTGQGEVAFPDTDLAVSLCKEDVSQDGSEITTKLRYTIWNENEFKRTGATTCVTCWFEDFLSNISEKFTRPNLATDMGRVRIEGIASSVCDVPDEPDTGENEEVISVDSPVISVAIKKIDIGNTGSVNAVAASTATTAGTISNTRPDDHGFLKYDQNPDVIPEKL